MIRLSTYYLETFPNTFEDQMSIHLNDEGTIGNGGLHLLLYNPLMDRLLDDSFFVFRTIFDIETFVSMQRVD